MSHITTQSYKKQLDQILEEELETSNASYQVIWKENRGNATYHNNNHGCF